MALTVFGPAVLLEAFPRRGGTICSGQPAPRSRGARVPETTAIGAPRSQGRRLRELEDVADDGRERWRDLYRLLKTISPSTQCCAAHVREQLVDAATL